MKIILIYILLLISGERVLSCPYEDYLRDAIKINKARQLISTNMFTESILLYNKAICILNLSTLDKINLAYAYSKINDSVGVDKTFRSLDVRYFIQSGDEQNAYDIFMRKIPDKYKGLKEREKRRMLDTLKAMNLSKKFKFFRHQYLVDQAIRGNVLHDSLSKYGLLDKKNKNYLMIKQSNDFYKYVKNNGWPDYAVAGKYPELLMMHDIENLEFYLPIIIRSAEKGLSDWIIVENLNTKIKGMNKSTRTRYADTIKLNFFNNNCSFVPDSSKLIVDKILKQSKNFKYIRAIIAFDTSFKTSNILSPLFPSDFCEEKCWGSLGIWFDNTLSKYDLFPQNPKFNCGPLSVKGIIKEFGKSSIVILEYYD